MATKADRAEWRRKADAAAAAAGDAKARELGVEVGKPISKKQQEEIDAAIAEAYAKQGRS